MTLPTLSKKTIRTISLLSIIPLTLISALTAPLVSPKTFIKGDKATNVEYVITKFDIFKPKITTLIPLGDGTIWASVEDYERVDLIYLKPTGTNDGKSKGNGFDPIDAKFNYSDITKAKSIASKNDLSKINPDPKTIDGKGVPYISKDDAEYAAKKDEANKPENIAFDLIDFVDYSSTRGVGDFGILKYDGKYDTLQKQFNGSSGRRGINGISPLQTFPKENNHTEYQVKITNNPRVKFLAFKVECAPTTRCDGTNNDLLKAANIVLKDRTIIPVPINANGEFDFNSVKSQWE